MEVSGQLYDLAVPQAHIVDLDIVEKWKMHCRPSNRGRRYTDWVIQAPMTME
jgi:hypothetical protein